MKINTECRNPPTNSSLRTSVQNWVSPCMSWVENKDSLQERTQLFPVDGSVCGHCSSAEKDAEDMKHPEEDGAGQLSKSDALRRRFRHQRYEIRDGKKFQLYRPVKAGSSLQEDPPHSRQVSPVKGQPKPSLVTEKTLPQESFISKVPLRLQIKVSGQRGGLGISIAGGKGSLPYKDHDEGIFISRVTTGGPSERAGVHVGDRLLEVNGVNMRGAAHHDAVSALRNAGSCIKMKVLRERLLPPEICVQDEPPDAEDVKGPQLCIQDPAGQRNKQQKMDITEDSLSKRMHATVCNGHGIPDLPKELNSKEASVKNDPFQGMKQTMTIPRIILTHPSTSDEDVELLTQSPGREMLHDIDIIDRHMQSDCFDSAFYPP